MLGLDEAGRFLFGDTTVNPGWLQNTLSSVSSQETDILEFLVKRSVGTRERGRGLFPSY